MKYLIGLVAFLLIATPTSAAEFEKNIRFGSKGSEVSKLQEFLAEQGLYSYQITGNFYSLTLKAVKAFQTREGLPSTGFVGSLTRSKINSILEAQLAGSEQEQEFSTSPEIASSTNDLIAYQNKVIATQILEQQKQTELLKQQNELLKSQTTTVIYVQPPITESVNQPKVVEPVVKTNPLPKVWTEKNWDWSRMSGDKLPGKNLKWVFKNFPSSTTITFSLSSTTSTISRSSVGERNLIFYFNEEDDIWDKNLTQIISLEGDDIGSYTFTDVYFSSRQ